MESSIIDPIYYRYFESPGLSKIMEALEALHKSHDGKQRQLMQKISWFTEEEAFWQKQVEPRGRQLSLIRDYIHEHQKKKDENLNPAVLMALYEKEQAIIFQDFMVGRREFICSRDYLFDRQKRDFVHLDEENRAHFLKVFEKGLKKDLDTHQKEFIAIVNEAKSLKDLSDSLEKLERLVMQGNDELDDLLMCKTPYMNAYSDNEDLYVRQKIKLLNQGLLESAKNNDKTSCGYFLEKGADIKCQDEGGYSVLHLAKVPELLRYLIERSANLESGLLKQKPHDHRGFTPLHWHTLQGNLEAVKCLLEAGAKVEAKSHRQATPLFLATKTFSKLHKDADLQRNLIHLLMSYGANVRARNDEGFFVMGCSSGHEKDKFAELSRTTDEYLGEQAAKGIQAWRFFQAQQNQINALLESVKNLQIENAQLKKRVQQLEARDLPENKSAPSSPRFSTFF